ncbi:MAG: NUDIX domain-containing protein [Solirubrobacterales bacterium]|nr:NUDIX domain-containing protein [Solirubrobacterales bacterium]
MKALAGGVGACGYRLALLILRGWWMIRRPRSAGVRCVLRHRPAFVLVRHTYGDGGWMLPGGRLRQGEEPVHGAAREMAQELGVECRGWRQVGYLAARASYRRRSPRESYRRHGTYYLEAEVEQPVLHRRAAEVREVGWFRLDELPPDRSPTVDRAIENAWLT